MIDFHILRLKAWCNAGKILKKAFENGKNNC